MLFRHLNVRSLLPALDEIRDSMGKFHRPVVLGISESWLTSAVSLGHVMIPGCAVYRRDRASGRGGGVLVYVSHSCRSWRRLDLEQSSVEATWIELWLMSHLVLLCVVYRPPSSTMCVFDCVIQMLELAVGENKEVVLMGDLKVNLLITCLLRLGQVFVVVIVHRMVCSRLLRTRSLLWMLTILLVLCL